MIQQLPRLNGIDQYQYTADADKSIQAHFLHGTGFHASTLWPLLDHFEHPINALLSNVPGHGNSFQPPIDQIADWPAMANEIGKALEKRLDQPIVGIGHSMGAAVTLYMSVQRPHLFKQLILMDPIILPPWTLMFVKSIRRTGLWKLSPLVSGSADRRNHWPNLAAVKADLKPKGLYRNWHDDVLTAFVTHATEDAEQGGRELCCDPQWEAQIFGSYPKGLWPAIEKVSMPTTIIKPQNSFPFVPMAIRHAAKVNSNIRIHDFGKEHCFPMEQVSETAQLLEQLGQFDHVNCGKLQTVG